jgi:hypothetical protein
MDIKNGPKANPQRVTIERLAQMVTNGFDEMRIEISETKAELKKDIQETKEIAKEDNSILRRDMETGFETLNYKIDRLIENSAFVQERVSDHEVRIVRLERK